MDLFGKTVVITGSTSGIGLGIARGMASANANVVINGFGSAAEIEHERSTLEALGKGQWFMTLPICPSPTRL